MKSKVKLTILTPTYNRANKIAVLYDSLLRQSNFDFNWVVVDDGSSDNTSKLIHDLMKECPFRIYFIQLENGGKHRAINFAVNQVKTELLFIVDSDDYLTRDAIETILRDWELYKNRVIGLSYLRSYSSGRIIGSEFTSDHLVSSHSKERIIRNSFGDKAEVWKTSEFIKMPFLEFDDEKFFSEQHKYLSISGDGSVLFVNKSIYVCEYLEDGLSTKIRILQFTNPKGTLANALILSSKCYPIDVRFKSFLKVFAYSLISKSKFRLHFKDSDFGYFWLLSSPLGMIYFVFLKLQYLYLTK